MGNRRSGARELRLPLSHPNELFEPPEFDVANGVPPGDAGIDQIRRELNHRALRIPVRLVLEMPADHATSHIERRIKLAIERYSQTGIQRVERELGALYREGWQTLLIGAALLAASLLASTEILSSGAAKTFKDFFGNGLFLVAAWVGMWWPLETLIYSPRPFRHERKLLRAIGSMEIHVRPAGGL